MERTPKRKRAYSPRFKLQVISYAEQHSNNKASKEFNVTRSCVQDWKKKKEDYQKQLDDGGSKRRRLDGGGRKLKFRGMEEVLAEWIHDQRDQKLPISRNMILLKAAELNHELGSEEFCGNAGWLTRFMQRQNFSLRRRTTVCQKPPAEYVEKVVNFILFIRKHRLKNNYDSSSIIACDETAVWLDCGSDTTVEKKGAKQVIIKSTGHEKARITVMLSAASNGIKLKPFVLINRKRPVKALDKFKNKLVLAFNGTSWMNDTLTLKYINDVLGTSLFNRRLLVWDSFRSHISQGTLAELKKRKIDSAVVPGGCTKFIQAPDVCWNKPFKSKLRELYAAWLATGEKFYTKGNNVKAPDLEVVCDWIIQAWESLPADLITKSFKTCGISNDLGGSEDDRIHCLRPGEACEEGHNLLKAKQNELDEILLLTEADDSEDFHNIDEIDLSDEELIFE